MDIDQKMLMELAGQMGFDNKNQRAAGKAASMAGQYRNKSEEELLQEIMGLKREMKRDPAAFAKQMKAIRALRGMMSGEQRQRLDRVIALLERDD